MLIFSLYVSFWLHGSEMRRGVFKYVIITTILAKLHEKTTDDDLPEKEDPKRKRTGTKR